MLKEKVEVTSKDMSRFVVASYVGNHFNCYLCWSESKKKFLAIHATPPGVGSSSEPTQLEQIALAVKDLDRAERIPVSLE